MTIKVENITRTNGNIVYSFSTTDQNGYKSFYTTAPLDIATLQAQTPTQRRATLIAAARAAAIPPTLPSFGINIGDTFDIGS